MDISVEDAGHVLGVLRWRAEQILGVHDSYDLGVVEQAATQHYRFVDHDQDPYSYWVSSGQAAEILGVSISRVKQIYWSGRLPALTHVSRGGRLMMRRTQVEVIANARESRKLAARHES